VTASEAQTSSTAAARGKGAASRRYDLLAKRLGHSFKDPALLRSALVHRSYLNENPDQRVESNERLEFLGDSILGSVIARRLYDEYPHANEGWLTEVRSLLVRNETLAHVATEFDLGRYLVMGRGVEAQKGRERPAILGRTCEAIIGAIYLDGGQRAAQRFIFRALAAQMEAIGIAGLQRDPKSVLQQACQAQWRMAPSYRTVDERGPAHDREFTVEVRLDGRVLASGEGKSKQAAEKVAAELALSGLPVDAIS
jgi:ribonuclease-3